MSEIRGLVLVLVGMIFLCLYYSWWLRNDRLSSPLWVAGFIVALVGGNVYFVANWVVYLATHYRSRTMPKLTDGLTVDVFVTVCGEELALVERSVRAACAMHGDHHTWLLDDGANPALASLAAAYGAGYLSRTDRRHAKAGNVNAALAQTNGAVIALFDIDHAPEKDFLRKSLDHFADKNVGFVQIMPTFANTNESWIAAAAAETSIDFYNPTSIGMDALRSVTKMGSNALIRRAALDSIGGYQPGLAEDLATSLAIHADGWCSAYVAEPLAPGHAPPDLAAWFTQQFKWARGVFEVLLTSFPQLFPRLSWGESLSYLVRMTRYWIGPAIFVHLCPLLFVLYFADKDSTWVFISYLLALFPVLVWDQIIRQLALNKWRHPHVSSGPFWKATILVYGTWPIYTLAWLMALFRVPLAFRPTPKTTSRQLHFSWILPHLLITILLLGGTVQYLARSVLEWHGFVLIGMALLQSIPHSVILFSWLFNVARQQQSVGETVLKIRKGQSS